jgi:hypothetical protein
MWLWRVPAGLAAFALVSGLAGGAVAAPRPRDRRPPTKPTIHGERAPRNLRPVFTFGATDRRTPRSRIRFRCAFDRAALRPCARIHRPNDALSFGRHVLRARALDRAGNASRIASYSFTVVGAWDAANDFERAPRPANPGRDRYGNTTWFYLYSGTPAHDPSNYHLLPFFAVLAPNWEVWRNQADGLGGSQVGFNNNQIIMNPGHWNLGQNAVLGWRSPVASTIRLAASIGPPADNCGGAPNWIAWSIDQGSRTLQSGVLARGGTPTDRELTASVAAGEMLYLVINDAGDSNCDTTLVALTVETQ